MIRSSFAALPLLLAVHLACQAPVDPAGVTGTRMFCGGGKLPPEIQQRFVELAGGEEACIVVVPTASTSADDPKQREDLLHTWQQKFPKLKISVLHAQDRATADSEAFVGPIRHATGLWFGGGAQDRLAAAYLGTRTECEVMALLARGGVVGGTSAGAAIQSRTMIAEGNPDPVMAQGLDLLPDGILDQHFLRRNRLPRLRAALSKAPGHFGLGIDEGTCAELRGRTLRVFGASKALLVLPAVQGAEERIVELADGASVDVVTWQRAARGRSQTPWPPKSMRDPRVANGTLVIVGGGGLPDAAIEAFAAAAGGAKAKVVIVPSANGNDVSGELAFAQRLRKTGISDLRTFHLPHPSQVTEASLAPLADATAIWFGGGRQWRLCDAYDGTPAIAAFAAVLARGGVIGGSSAGATIQGEFLVRGNPLGNTDMWCEGYDRGFGYLPGVAIDQHFLARKRIPDLQNLIAKAPQMIGLGIDESTALVVRGSVAEVVGASKVAVFDVRNAEPSLRAKPEPKWLQAGDRWDLVAGRRAE